VKIVQIVPEMNEGGVERGTVELSKELVCRGYESYVISSGGKLVKRLEKEGGTHLSMDVASKNPLTVPRRIRELTKLLKSLNPDVIHVRSRIPAWLTRFAAANMQIPIVSTVHGFNSIGYYSKIMTQFDHTICVSTAVKEYVLRHYHLKEESITVIPRGVDLDRFTPERLDENFIETFRSDFGLEGRYVVSNVGRITQLKGLEFFIDAIALTKRIMPEIKGVIVGGVRQDKERYYRKLRQKVKRLGLENEIVFVGSQSNIAEIYALSDVVVNSSIKPESFGRSAAESLAMGTPVVAAAHGGILDIVISGKTGMLYSPSDARELSEKLINVRGKAWQGLREYIEEHFSLKQMVDRTVEVYEGLR
jgi:glycosyltransferase involved in cell wall biosynthesis